MTLHAHHAKIMPPVDIDIITALNAAHSRTGTWRAVAAIVGVNHATLCGIAKGKPVSKPLLRRIQRALGVPTAPRRRLHRPVASDEHEARRQRLGVTWAEVHEAGLRALEQEQAK